MAHADYDCCAVCDSKMNYNPDAEAKSSICGYCLKRLYKEFLVDIDNVHELMDWVNSVDSSIIRQVLAGMGYSKCYYENPVDDAVAMKLGR